MTRAPSIKISRFALAVDEIVAQPRRAPGVELTNLKGRKQKEKTKLRNYVIGAFLRSTLAMALLVSAAALMFSPSVTGEKMKPEEVVAKHLESVGTPEARAAIKNRVALGSVIVTFRTPSVGQAPGRIVMASEGDKNLLGMMFDETNYPQEKAGFDGKDVSVSYVRPGERSMLGDFLQIHKAIVKQGLLGGSVSQAWPLYDMETRKPKLSYSGLKKVDDKDAHALKLQPKGADFDVTLYFDAQTFQHVRTEYTRTIAALMGDTSGVTTPAARDARINQSARGRESKFRMVEDYSDFRKEGNLTLPHKYKITFEASLPAGSYKAEWYAELAQYGFNQDIDPKSFDVDGQ